MAFARADAIALPEIVMQKSALKRIVAFATVSVVTLLACTIPYTTAYRNMRYARMSLKEQLQTEAEHLNDPLFLTYLGRRLNDEQRFQQALPIAERAVGLDPDSARARDEWTRALLGTGQVTGAFGQLKQFLGTHPNSSEAQFLMAKFYLTQQNLTPARHALEETVRLDPKHAEAWSMLANVRMKAGEYAEARIALETALRLRPNQAQDHMQLAVLLTPTDVAGARSAFMRAVALAPNDALCHRQYSRFLLDSGDPIGAEREARRAFALDNRDMFTAVLVGRSLLAQAKGQEAIPFLEEARRLAPLETIPVDALRRAYKLAGDSAKAADCEVTYLHLLKGAEERRRLEDKTIASPEDREAHARFAYALAEIGDVNGVIRQYALASKSVPDNPKVLVAAARDLNRAGHSAEALPLARAAMKEKQNSPDAIETLGDTLLNLGRPHEAAINFERIRDWKAAKRPEYARRIKEVAARLAKSDAPAEQLLRQALQESAPQKSELLLNKALTIEPENTRCLRALLRIQFAQQEREAATATAQRLATISPEDGLSHALLAILMLEPTNGQAINAEALQSAEMHLKASEYDFSVAPTIYYGFGLLALRRGKTEEAIKAFDHAAHLDPNALGVYRKLAEAKEKAGDMAGSKLAMSEFERRLHTLQTEGVKE